MDTARRKYFEEQLHTDVDFEFPKHVKEEVINLLFRVDSEARDEGFEDGQEYPPHEPSHPDE